MTQTNAISTIAFDRASARALDGDGHLHVKQTHISKAMVCPYLGREIPDADRLGLDEDKIYYLFRDPQELAKAAGTFNGKPLLYDHKPVHADAHDHDLTVGALSNATWNPPYLDADLSCWSGSAIRTIEDGSQKQLSSAYRYRADMTPGTHEGVRFDGVMRDIVGNHVALVREGRAGPDVVVGDSLENITMAKTALTRAGATTQGALAIYLRPKLAADAKIDLSGIVSGLTSKNFKARQGKLTHDIKKATTGKLAQDASLEDVGEVIEALADILPEEVPEIVEEMGGTEDDGATDEGSDDDLRAKLEAAGVPADVIAKVLAATGEAGDPPPAMDADKDEKKDKPPAMDTSKFVTKQAMDSAVRVASDAAAKRATEAAIRTQQEIREAERAVRPFVGDLAMAHDSADAVYRTALTSLNINVEGVHPSAFPTILSMQPKPGDAPRRQATPIAQDAKQAEDYSARFPHANRLK